jgi:hypothetical protein
LKKPSLVFFNSLAGSFRTIHASNQRIPTQNLLRPGFAEAFWQGWFWLYSPCFDTG